MRLENFANDNEKISRDKVEEIPGMRAAMILNELSELIPKTRRLYGTGRLRSAIQLRRNVITQRSAEALTAAFLAVEKSCNKAEEVMEALQKDRLNRLLLAEAQTVKAQLESEVAIAEGL